MVSNTTQALHNSFFGISNPLGAAFVPKLHQRVQVFRMMRGRIGKKHACGSP